MSEAQNNIISKWTMSFPHLSMLDISAKRGRPDDGLLNTRRRSSTPREVLDGILARKEVAFSPQRVHTEKYPAPVCDVGAHIDNPPKFGRPHLNNIAFVNDDSRLHVLYDAFAGFVGLLLRQEIHLLLRQEIHYLLIRDVQFSGVPFSPLPGDDERLTTFNSVFGAHYKYTPYDGTFWFGSNDATTYLFKKYQWIADHINQSTLCKYGNDECTEAFYDLHVYFIRFVSNYKSETDNRMLTGRNLTDIRAWLFRLFSYPQMKWIYSRTRSLGFPVLTRAGNPIVRMGDGSTAGYDNLIAYWTAKARARMKNLKFLFLLVLLYNKAIKKRYAPYGAGFKIAQQEFEDAQRGIEQMEP